MLDGRMDEMEGWIDDMECVLGLEGRSLSTVCMLSLSDGSYFAMHSSEHAGEVDRR